jgi:solute carrier family 26 (sodium-independent sulfate anion transporter), member 11
LSGYFSQFIDVFFFGSSQVDTTSVQALIDTRQEVERWTNRPVEFHFATILSPWIRRCLIAGGFGYEHSSRAHDVTSVVSYDASQAGPSQSDVETGESKGSLLPDPSYGEIRQGEASAVQIDTPYFHLDLAEAVAAAEAGLLTLTPQSSATPSVRKGDDKVEVG